MCAIIGIGIGILIGIGMTVIAIVVIADNGAKGKPKKISYKGKIGWMMKKFLKEG